MFKKNKENFICEKCGAEVFGNGYTNHCPKCLWSKHVDVGPGDRAAVCGGMMKLVKVEMKGAEFILTHECEKCGYRKRNKTAHNDDLSQIPASVLKSKS